VLAPAQSGFARPLDLLYLQVPPPAPGESAGPAAVAEHEPVLVLSKPGGVLLSQWRRLERHCSPACVRIIGQVLSLLERAHERGQLFGALGMDDFLVDSAGRLFCMASDRVLPAREVAKLRWLYPPDRYPVGFRAPELADPEAVFDQRADLYSWAALAFYLISGAPPLVALPASPAGEPPATMPLESWRAAERALLAAARRDPSCFGSIIPRSICRSARRLTFALLIGIGHCLRGELKRRISSVQELRTLMERATQYYPFKFYLLGSAREVYELSK
jgi:hypothetical protein